MTPAEKGVFWAIVIVGMATWFRFWWIERADKKLRLEGRERMGSPEDRDIDFMQALRPIGRVPRLDQEIHVYRGAGVDGPNREGIAGLTHDIGPLDRRGRSLGAGQPPRARSAGSVHPGNQEAA